MKTLSGFSSGNTVSSVTSDINSRLSALSTKVDGIQNDYVTKEEKQGILDTISSLETGVTNSIEEIKNASIEELMEVDCITEQNASAIKEYFS